MKQLILIMSVAKSHTDREEGFLNNTLGPQYAF